MPTSPPMAAVIRRSTPRIRMRTAAVVYSLTPFCIHTADLHSVECVIDPWHTADTQAAARRPIQRNNPDGAEGRRTAPHTRHRRIGFLIYKRVLSLTLCH